MATLIKYNLQGEKVGNLDVSQEWLDESCNAQVVKEYIVALHNNQRQWSANTKRRFEVNHSTQKPHPQKGTGRARQGSLASTQFRGGGRPKGPKPKFDQHIRINKEERRAAIRQLIAEKIKNDKVCVVDSFILDAPKTKQVGHFLKKVNLNRSVLFLGDELQETIEDKTGKKMRVSKKSDRNKNFQMSVRNIPFAKWNLAMNVSGLDVAKSHNLIFTEKAWEQVVEWLS